MEKATALAAAFSAVLALASPTPVAAQQQATGPQRVDSIVVVGNSRVAASSVQAVFGVQPGTDVTYRDIQRGLKSLLAGGQFKDVEVHARGSAPGITLVLQVQERPLVRRVSINGLQHGSERQVRDTTGLKPGIPYDPQSVLDAKAFIRAKLAKDGIPFATIDDRLESVPGDQNQVDVILDVTEGQRVTVADMVFRGNDHLTDDQLKGAMSTKAEGFWWFHSGAFDNARFQTDISENLPGLYHGHGFLDFQVLSDTLVVDPQTGKARVEVDVQEGPQYRLASFSIDGNSHFDDEQLERFFRRSGGGLLSSLGLGGNEEHGQQGEIFDAEAFNEAVAQAKQLYANDGYLYAQISPIVQRHPAEAPGEDPTVDASWQIQEGQPAIVNRVSIAGNEYTYERVIRERISTLPGDVYSQDRLLRSYQSISSLGFFESPMPVPDIQPLDNGDVDITFHVKEKQTGS
ncbi:MAG: POTRA domain-containing protein, partial [Gemmatimonadota bacterium]